MAWTEAMKKAHSKRLKEAWAKKKAGPAVMSRLVDRVEPKPTPPFLTEEFWKREDLVNHPSHYTSHPSKVECIEITEHLNFCVGNAIKYLWRAGKKGYRTQAKPVEHSDYVVDLKKAIWYIQREIDRVSK